MSAPDPGKVLCRNPDPTKAGVSIASDKFDAVRQAILDVVRDSPVPLSQMTAAVSDRLGPEGCAAIGRIGWYMMAVKLELEVRGEIARLKGSPQRLVLGEGKA